MAEILMIMLAAILTENFIFIKFMGICPFLGVSDKIDKSLGMGFAVIFVMTLSSAVTWVVYHFMLVPLGLEYLQTIAFILIIASLISFDKAEFILNSLIWSAHCSIASKLSLVRFALSAMPNFFSISKS